MVRLPTVRTTASGATLLSGAVTGASAGEPGAGFGGAAGEGCCAIRGGGEAGKGKYTGKFR